MSNIVAFINQKGGVAKTTTALNVASAWGMKRRVLLIDIDPQASATKAILGDVEVDKTVYDVMMNNLPAEEAIVSSEAYHVDLMPSEIMLSGVDIQIAATIGREKLLRQKLASVRRRYDAIVIDCPPSLGLLTINALMAANDIVIPICPEYFSVRGLDLILDTIKNIRTGLGHKVNIRGIVITRYKSRKITNQIIEDIRKEFNIKVFHDFVPDNIAIEEAHNRHLPVHEHAPNSSAAKAMLALSRNLWV